MRVNLLVQRVSGLRFCNLLYLSNAHLMIFWYYYISNWLIITIYYKYSKFKRNLKFLDRRQLELSMRIVRATDRNPRSTCKNNIYQKGPITPSQLYYYVAKLNRCYTLLVSLLINRTYICILLNTYCIKLYPKAHQ